MQNNYIVRTKENLLICFYHIKDNGIYCKKYENNRWAQDELIIPGASEYYTINMAESGELYLFCQNEKGDIMLCRNDGKKWAKKIILKNTSKTIQNITFNAIITDYGLCLIYNIPSEDGKRYNLTSQSLDNKGKWLEATKIDTIIPFPESIFQLQPIGRNHSIVFYQKKGLESDIGYREITPSEIGKFNIFHSTNYRLTDHSFMTTNERIHMIYIIKSMFSNQLIYRKKEDKGFSNPIVLWEGPKLTNCCLTIVKNQLYVTWIYNNQLYYCISEDNGDTFSKSMRYKRKFCLSVKKAIYLSYEKMQENNFVCHELYIDSTNNSDIQLLPDLYDNFYPEKIAVKPEVIEKLNTEFQDDYNENLEKLKNQVNLSLNELSQKDKQIMQLSSSIHLKNEEILKNEVAWKNKYKKLWDEKKELSDTNEKLKIEIIELKNKLKSFNTFETKQIKKDIQKEEIKEDENDKKDEVEKNEIIKIESE